MEKELKNKLETQSEDGVKPVLKSVVFGRHVLSRPADFDNNYVKRSVQNMNYLLHNNGYHGSNIQADCSKVHRDIRNEKADPYRLKVNYNVITGSLFRIESISYRFNDTALQRLVNESKDKSLLKKSEAFSNQKIDEELNRLIDVFRNNGFYRINREMLKAQLDTVNVSLIDASADPFEQIQLQVEARKEYENPTIDIAI